MFEIPAVIRFSKCKSTEIKWNGEKFFLSYAYKCVGTDRKTDCLYEESVGWWLGGRTFGPTVPPRPRWGGEGKPKYIVCDTSVDAPSLHRDNTEFCPTSVGPTSELSRS